MKNRSLINYSWWVDYKGVWELKQAANLYLGFDPDVGGTFDSFKELLAKHDSGLILTDSETVWPVSVLKIPGANTEWNDVLDKDGNCKISLETFIKDMIEAGKIKKVTGDHLPFGLHFKPIEIVSFFQEHF
ncbi:MAG: hypothetical protein ACAH80_10380, partial [Alphaproteobacteria bacterium]